MWKDTVEQTCILNSPILMNTHEVFTTYVCIKRYDTALNLVRFPVMVPLVNYTDTL